MVISFTNCSTYIPTTHIILSITLSTFLLLTPRIVIWSFPIRILLNTIQWTPLFLLTIWIIQPIFTITKRVLTMYMVMATQMSFYLLSSIVIIVHLDSYQHFLQFVNSLFIKSCSFPTYIAHQTVFFFSPIFA